MRVHLPVLSGVAAVALALTALLALLLSGHPVSAGAEGPTLSVTLTPQATGGATATYTMGNRPAGRYDFFSVDIRRDNQSGAQVEFIYTTANNFSSVTLSSDRVLTNGTYWAYARAVCGSANDGCGTVGTEYTAITTFTVNVVPNSAPVFDPFANDNKPEATQPDGATLPADFLLPTATDADSARPGDATDVTCTAPVGPGGTVVVVAPGQTPFPIGSITVTCAATDIAPAGGVAGPDVTSTFTLQVLPKANTDYYTAEAGRLLEVPAPGLIANDFGVVRARRLEAVNNDRAYLLREDGSFGYRRSEPGEYTESYPAFGADGTQVSGWIVITVIAANQAPTFVAGTIPTNVTARTAGDATTAPISFVPPAATDPDSTQPGNATGVTCTAPIGTGGATVPVTTGIAFPAGTTTVTCTATDVVPENTTARTPVTTSFTVIVTDGGSPLVTGGLTNRSAAATSANGAPVTFPLPTATDAIDQQVTVTCDPASGSTFPLGPTTVTCTARDDAGNEATGTFTVTVTDQGQPNLGITVPNVVEATGPSGAPVTFTATADDAVDGPLTPTCTVPDGSGTRPVTSGATFPLGDTPLTCTAVDRAGNRTTDTITVTVRDTTAPSFGPLANVTAAATGPNGAVVTYTLPGATDTVDQQVAVSCTPASGSTFALGTTTVSCTATDDATNRATGTFTVTVTDQAAPVFTSIPNVTVGATSNYGAVVTYALPTATDNTTTPTVSCLPAPGSQFPIGTTTVTCTASDGVNVTSGSFTVTVTNNGFRDPRDPRPGASPQTQPPTTPTPRPARPPRG